MPVSITLDCVDVERQARFWAEALGYRAHPVDAGGPVLLRPDEDRFGLGILVILQPVPEQKTAKNRLHLDWDVADMDREAARLVALGAHRGERFDKRPVSHIAMTDPEGNEFCVEQVVDPGFRLPG